MDSAVESLSQRGDKIATTEFLKIKVTRSGRGPEAQRIDGLAAVAHNWPIMRNTRSNLRDGAEWRASSRRVSQTSSSG